jgi:hypothetical protein
MKNRLLYGSFVVIAGLLTSIGPQTIFKICEPSHHGIENCFWTGQAAIGIGALLAALGLASALFSNKGARAGLSLAIGGNSALMLLVANLLIGVHEDPMMQCRIAALPALNVISVLTVAASAANFALLSAKGEDGGARAHAAADSV